jgi:hypothetical protein
MLLGLARDAGAAGAPCRASRKPAEGHADAAARCARSRNLRADDGARSALEHPHLHLGRSRDDRFLGEARKNIDRFAYLPFGAGPRTCTGSAFALQEATLVLAAIMRKFNLTLAPRHKVWPLLRVTLRPAGGLPMTVRRRAACRSKLGYWD